MNLLRGILEIATGRAGGLSRFGDTPRDFLASLYVLMCVPAIFALLMAARRGLDNGLIILLVLVCALLAPAVISHAIARLWGREAMWLRFATAFNWSRFAVVAAFAIMLMATAVLIGAGIPSDNAAELLVTAVSVYSLWLEWFIARHALRLSGVRAVGLVLAMNIGTFLMLAIPGIIVRLLLGGGLVD